MTLTELSWEICILCHPFDCGFVLYNNFQGIDSDPYICLSQAILIHQIMSHIFSHKCIIGSDNGHNSSYQQQKWSGVTWAHTTVIARATAGIGIDLYFCWWASQSLFMFWSRKTPITCWTTRYKHSRWWGTAWGQSHFFKHKSITVLQIGMQKNNYIYTSHLAKYCVGISSLRLRLMRMLMLQVESII